MVLHVGRHGFGGTRRWSLAAAAVLFPAAACLTAGAGAYPAAGGPAVCCAELVAAAPAGTPADTLKVSEFSSAAVLASSSRGMVRDARFALPAGVASERGLQVETILAARAISAMFPEIHDIGGVRPDALRWHPNGLALDVMIPDYRSAAGKALGDRIAAYALANADRFDLNHVIWRQVLYMPGSAPRTMSNYGSDDANHYTHVHIATNGGGFPTGHEVYFTSAAGPAVAGGPSTVLVSHR